MHLDQKNSEGFTQLELLIALAVLSLAMAFAAQALTASFTRLEQLREASTRGGDRQIAAAVMARDLRCAFIAGDRPAVLMAGRSASGSDRLDFVRIGGSSGGDAAEMEIGYELERDSESGQWNLARRSQTPVDADIMAGGRKTVLCRNLTEFRLRYFDGEIWSDQWGWDAECGRPREGIRGLPLLVSVELDETRFVFPVLPALLNFNG